MTKMKLGGCFLVLIGLFAGSCAMDDSAGFRISTLTFDFDKGNYEWQHGFADFPSDTVDSAGYALGFGYEQVPQNAMKGLKLTGHNRSDDLFMYVKKKITGLDRSTQYTITFDIEFASEAKEGEMGAGGAPGESVYLKVGATNVEPKTLIEDDMFVMNIDKGDQSENGMNMIVIGNIAAPGTKEGYELCNRTNSPYNNTDYNEPVVVTTNNDGEMWLIIGTDSGYEGVTTIYYTNITAVLSQVR